MNFTFHVMKNVNFIDVNNQTINFYVNYIIKIDNENVFVQTYVINNLTIEILLNVDIIENYNMNLLIFKRIIDIKQNQISITFNKIDDIIINYVIINSFVSINALIVFKIITLLKINSFKFAFFTNNFNNSIFRIFVSINKNAKTSQKIDKKN